MAGQSVTVFGGTGFLGRRIVRHLHETGFAVRIASRHPERGPPLSRLGNGAVEAVHADVNHDRSVEAAVAGAFAAVNAVSLYVEGGSDTFRSVHVEAAARVARLARRAGAQRLVHISGIGADARSPSPYIRSRGEGEAAVLETFPAAVLLRPAVMFGPDDAFLVPLFRMLRRLPAFPLFGGGETRLQPVNVEDVAEAVARVLRAPAPHRTYELGGPRVYTYRELLRTIVTGASFRTLLFPFPFAAWRALGYLSEFLPNPPITANQVDLMKQDNVAATDLAGFAALRIVPQGIEETLPEILRKAQQAEEPRAHG
jgi:uncharacterized protein YbjT (DUF2867 family)